MQESLGKAILEIFKKHPYKAFNHKQVFKQLLSIYGNKISDFIHPANTKPETREQIISLLQQLLQQGEVIEMDYGKYKLFPQESFAEGKIDITSTGAAYLTNEDYEDDIYIAPKNVNNALNGDKVKVLLSAKREGKRMEGEVIEILERAKTEFAGLVQVSPKFAFLVPDSNKMNVDIFIPLSLLNGARHGEKAVAAITEWLPEAKNPTGEIIKVLGMPGENNAEMDAILVEYGFPLQFPAMVEKEAETIPYEITGDEIKRRRDFRKVTTFTIDPADAKDFDDALSIKDFGNGRWEIGVHIADVSHYVQPGTELEKEAYNRATSIYLVDRVIPMLPEKLSNNVCSLRPDEEKLCYSAVFILDEDANVLEEWFGRTIIKSDKRFSYEEAQQVIETESGPLAKEILLFDRLAKKLRAERFRKGAISFEKVEVKFNLDEKGHPLGVYIKESKDANKLIEEFMLLANRKVAEFVGKKGSQQSAAGSQHIQDGKKTFIYRVHDVPSGDRLENFAQFAGKFGYKIKTDSEKEISQSLNQLMKNIHGKPEENVLEQLAIRTMAKAIYTTENIGHYGLAFDYYTHFTSPIRRYPDVMVHRLLDHYLRGGNSVAQKDYEVKCKHSTDMEILASEAERASIKYKQVQFMTGKYGQVFDGIISGVTEWGIYVEIVENKCEGLIRLRDIGDDFYEFDEKNYCIKGLRTKRVFRLGDSIKVILNKTDLVKKQIDFALYGSEAGKKPSLRSEDRYGRRQEKKVDRTKQKKYFSEKKGNKKRR
ncbi:MAG TPA: ribonuclease R [Bacteroidia bacterium]|nr:ribonuclease R [Bacteroidia bacterium]